MLLHQPVLSDRAAVREAVCRSGYPGSDASFGNLFLLRNKYHTLLGVENGFLFRFYEGQGSRLGYTFPLGKGNWRSALSAICADAEQNGRPLRFCLVDAERRVLLQEFFGGRIRFEADPGDSDYLYDAEALASLAGKQYQKKRNHISRFYRAYPDCVLHPITGKNTADAMAVETAWLHDGNSGRSLAQKAENAEDEASKTAEANAIGEALEHFDALGMHGAVLYAEDQPVGMTMATEILPGVWDIHFEKVIGEFAAQGGYAVINKLFAQSLEGAVLLNREEDINLEGLRRAKQSYFPVRLLEKFHGIVGEEEC